MPPATLDLGRARLVRVSARPGRDRAPVPGSASLAIVNQNSHLAGLVSGMGIPCVELTSDPGYSPDPRLPVEDQPRRFDPAQWREAPGRTVTSTT